MSAKFSDLRDPDKRDHSYLTYELDALAIKDFRYLTNTDLPRKLKVVDRASSLPHDQDD